MTNLKERWSRYEARASRQRAVVAPDDTQHVCLHCGHDYQGRFCPQCGLRATQGRFTLKSLFASFLDLWGLGSRPLRRTVGELLWRPGYMIRDYLGGHHLYYFPPFKMLVVFTLFFLSILRLAGVTPKEAPLFVSGLQDAFKDSGNASLFEATMSVVSYLTPVMDWFDRNVVYLLIVKTLLMVLAVWLTFRRRSAYTLTETFFAQIYITCQMMLLAVPVLLVTRTFEAGNLLPYYLPDELVVLVLAFDFHQLYGTGLWRSLWLSIRSILTLLFVFIAFLSVVSLVFGVYIGYQLHQQGVALASIC